MTQLRADLDRIENLALTAMREQHQLIRRVSRLEQATLELAAALRRSGITPQEEEVLPSTPDLPVPDRQNAEASANIRP